MTDKPANLATGATMFRLGAIALAAGTSPLWSGVAKGAAVVPDLITQVYNLPLIGTNNITIGNGDLNGGAQFTFVGVAGNGGYLQVTPNGSAGLEYQCCKVSDLAPGSVVGSGDLFATPSIIASDNVVTEKNGAVGSMSGYLGLEFDLLPAVQRTGAEAGDPFGFATIDNGNLVSITYDANGGPVTVPTPEPASLALLAFGATGVLALRRRRAPTMPSRGRSGLG